ncbi:hypothetical protein VNO78_07711 [Psophocarpus tetragonolobus]|uniref:RNase H type-1 domain-containing protein n=1 Tax=Psophocarpus tetragonolobus TaxID=3891 RepID=A0AAN9SWP0_PSOTE
MFRLIGLSASWVSIPRWLQSFLLFLWSPDSFFLKILVLIRSFVSRQTQKWPFKWSLREHPHAAIVSAIRAMLCHDREVIFQHTLREGNACVDWLAKAGVKSQMSFSSLNACPASLVADAVGTLVVRL